MQIKRRGGIETSASCKNVVKSSFLVCRLVDVAQTQHRQQK